MNDEEVLRRVFFENGRGVFVSDARSTLMRMRALRARHGSEERYAFPSVSSDVSRKAMALGVQPSFVGGEGHYAMRTLGEIVARLESAL